MAKLKKTENMSALDYLCKELNWLAKKIEASSRGKISKRDLLIYGLIIIFILSVGLGGVIGAFTFVLAVATIWNAYITRGLLKQSKAAFESDVFRRIVFSTLQLDAQLKIARMSERGPYTVGLTVGMLKALEKSDPSTYRKIRETMEIWSKSEKMKGPEGIFREALKKTKQERQELNNG